MDIIPGIEVIAPMLRRLWAHYAGTRDGSLLIPQAADPSPWILSVWAGAQADAQQIKMATARLTERLESRRQAAAQALAQTRAALEKAESAEARSAEAHAATLLQAEQRKSSQSNPMGHGMPTWAYVPAVMALCAMEFPLVYLSFTTFGLEPLYTLLLAALCSALTGFLGHAAGTLSRNLRINVRPVLALLLVGSLAFVASLAYLRESAMAALTSDTLTVNPVAAAWALFAISCATMVAAALLAWHHRVEPLAHELHRTARGLRRAHGDCERLRRRLLRLSAREARLTQRLQAAETIARARHEAHFAQTRALIRTYIAANVRAREDNRLPNGLHESQMPWHDAKECVSP